MVQVAETYTERLRSSLMALISIFLRPMVGLCVAQVGRLEKWELRNAVKQQLLCAASRLSASRGRTKTALVVDSFFYRVVFRFE